MQTVLRFKNSSSPYLECSLQAALQLVMSSKCGLGAVQPHCIDHLLLSALCRYFPTRCFPALTDGGKHIPEQGSEAAIIWSFMMTCQVSE